MMRGLLQLWLLKSIGSSVAGMVLMLWFEVFFYAYADSVYVCMSINNYSTMHSRYNPVPNTKLIPASLSSGCCLASREISH